MSNPGQCKTQRVETLPARNHAAALPVDLAHASVQRALVSHTKSQLLEVTAVHEVFTLENKDGFSLFDPSRQEPRGF